ncbi:MAG TPA: glycoside hydrolase family 11 protein [Polyangiaceae bacterium]|nr:glycoside hydrolase family 11 protein [Polyangiaceae bacterium]
MQPLPSRVRWLAPLTLALGCNAVFGINKPILDNGSGPEIEGGDAGQSPGRGGTAGNAAHGGKSGANDGASGSTPSGEDAGAAPSDGGGANGGSTSGGTSNESGGTTGSTNGGEPGSGGTVASGGTSASGGKAGGAPSTGGTVASGGGNGGAASGGKTSGGGGSVAASGAGSGGASGAGSGGVSGAGSGGTGAGGGPNCMGPALSGGTQHCSNYSGTVGSYAFSLWSAGATPPCMTTYGVGAAFKASWNNPSDVMARGGLQWDGSQTPGELGVITAQFAYTKTGSDGGYSYIGVYGWSVAPTCIEWYIVEDSFHAMPVNPGGTNKGTITLDGSQYTLYSRDVNGTGGSKCGNVSSWTQVYSVRQTARQCGQISVSEHFKAWATANMGLGKMDSATFLVQVGAGTGSVDFSLANITVQ